MNQIIEGIKQRRSCRSYEERQIGDEDLQELITCGLLAPSGMNQQGIHFTIIQDKAVLEQLKQMVGRDFIYGAPTLIVVHADKEYKYVLSDGSAAMENMYIAANALNLGACWINQLKDHYGDERLAKLGLEGQIITGSLAVGYPKEKAKTRDVNMDRVTLIK
ncbi:MAG: nitroreductase family protein [Erysipelotrichia bacterium]|nr:nitroreductase family protein [Erysipelotrichia bacterium]NCC55061.1 nitroreductase family protein [Erysipelotrichia bacterium]